MVFVGKGCAESEHGLFLDTNSYPRVPTFLELIRGQYRRHYVLQKAVDGNIGVVVCPICWVMGPGKAGVVL